MPPLAPARGRRQPVTRLRRRAVFTTSAALALQPQKEQCVSCKPLRPECAALAFDGGVEMKKIALALGIAALLAIPAGTAMTSGASAATVERNTITSTFTAFGQLDDCRPGVTGTIEGTYVYSYQRVETSTGYHLTATTLKTARIDWSDGTYTIIEGINHFSSNVDQGVREIAITSTESGDTYTADGVLLSQVTFRSVEQLTFSGDELRVHVFQTFGEGCPHWRTEP
jgi:hypothetical protein